VAGGVQIGANLVLASRLIKRKRETLERPIGLLSGGWVIENMRSDGEFVTSGWLWIMKTKWLVNR
jgi:hypothetical protein